MFDFLVTDQATKEINSQLTFCYQLDDFSVPSLLTVYVIPHHLLLHNASPTTSITYYQKTVEATRHTEAAQIIVMTVHQYVNI